MTDIPPTTTTPVIVRVDYDRGSGVERTVRTNRWKRGEKNTEKR